MLLEFSLSCLLAPHSQSDGALCSKTRSWENSFPAWMKSIISALGDWDKWVSSSSSGRCFIIPPFPNSCPEHLSHFYPLLPCLHSHKAQPAMEQSPVLYKTSKFPVEKHLSCTWSHSSFKAHLFFTCFIINQNFCDLGTSCLYLCQLWFSKKYRLSLSLAGSCKSFTSWEL